MRIFFFILMCFLALLTPFPLFLFASLLYVFLYDGYELLLIGMYIDLVFGTTVSSYVYTLSLGGLIVAGTILKPYMSWYSTSHAP